MEYRRLGRSGLKVSAISFGTATFGGSTEFFKAWGTSGVEEAKRLVSLCIEAGVNLFDTADVYSKGLAESILGEALEGRRSEILISTKATFPSGDGPNEFGSSRHHLIRSCEASLRRLRTDYIDLYHMHGFDSQTPLDETLRALDDLVRAGKVRYIACSNFSAWHLMKSLALSDHRGYARYVAHQTYYSLLGRELEHELIPLALDQGVGTIVWSPLAGGALTGKIRRGQAAPADSRLGSIDFVPFEVDRLHPIVDALDVVAKECGKSIAQVALNWVLNRPSIASVVVGARNETQLRQNLAALELPLEARHMEMLLAASAQKAPYPYWHQSWFPQLMPTLT